MSQGKTPFCHNGREYAIGESDLREYAGQLLDMRCCTLMLCLSGMATVSINSSRLCFCKSHIAILSYDMDFMPLMTTDDFRVAYLSMSASLCEDTFFKLTAVSFWDFLSRNAIIPLPEDRFRLLCGWFGALRHIISYSRDEYLHDILNNSIQNFFMMLHSETAGLISAGTECADRNRAWTLAGLFSEMLSQHYTSKRDVAFYARKLCVSPDYLSRIVYKNSGMTAKEMITGQVIQGIKSYLESTDLTIKSIADKMNFDNCQYMCHFFKNATGMTPTGFRNRKKTGRPANSSMKYGLTTQMQYSSTEKTSRATGEEENSMKRFPAQERQKSRPNSIGTRRDTE